MHFFSPVPSGHCDYIGAWTIEEGTYGDTRLDGLNVGLAARSPETNKIMLDGNWKALFYLDGRSNREQTEALTQIFTGKAGGALFPELMKLISEVIAVKSTKIIVSKDGKKFTVSVSGIMDASIEPVIGTQNRPMEIRNIPVAGTVDDSYIVAKSLSNNYHDDGLEWSYSGKNGYYGKFDYRSQ